MYHVQYLLSKITRQTFHDRGARLSEQRIHWRAQRAMFIIIANKSNTEAHVRVHTKLFGVPCNTIGG